VSEIKKTPTLHFPFTKFSAPYTKKYSGFNGVLLEISILIGIRLRDYWLIVKS
jgi:hypothetical protein